MNRKKPPPVRNRPARPGADRIAPPPTAAPAPERIQKVLAQAGLGSRREIEQWIAAGRVLVNGQPAELGERITLADRVEIDGRPVRLPQRLDQPTRVLLYNKPSGEVVARRDPEGRPVVFTQLPSLRRGRWIAVGRLDINTQGLLLFTNDGELANRLMHPAQGMTREYAVRIYGEVDETMLARLREGVKLDDGPARFDCIQDEGGEGANHWYKVQVHEGRNRLVRRLWESQGVTVSRLIRLAYGPVQLPPRLRPCTFYELTVEEVAALKAAAGMTPDEKTPVQQVVRGMPERPSQRRGRRSHPE